MGDVERAIEIAEEGLRTAIRARAAAYTHASERMKRWVSLLKAAEKGDQATIDWLLSPKAYEEFDNIGQVVM